MNAQDQIGQLHVFREAPKRIVSLVPSITEWLWDLGLEQEVVGITKFCVKPEDWFRSKPRVGGTKQVNIERVKALSPDLILANKEENDASDVEALGAICPVWVSDVKDWETALEMMQLLGIVLEKVQAAESLANRIEFPRATRTRTAVYAVWNEPLMVAGSDTFIHDTMHKLGFENVVQDARYPALSDEALRALNPEVLLLPSEPFPFSEKHLPGLQARFPDQQLMLVDGEMFSWYGSRMKYVAEYGKALWQEVLGNEESDV